MKRKKANIGPNLGTGHWYRRGVGRKIASNPLPQGRKKNEKEDFFHLPRVATRQWSIPPSPSCGCLWVCVVVHDLLIREFPTRDLWLLTSERGSFSVRSKQKGCHISRHFCCFQPRLSNAWVGRGCVVCGGSRSWLERAACLPWGERTPPRFWLLSFG